MIINEKKISTYYQDLNCETCGSLTDYGEAIAVKVPEIIFTNFNTYKATPLYIRVCPRCYRDIVTKKAIAQKMRR